MICSFITRCLTYIRYPCCTHSLVVKTSATFYMEVLECLWVTFSLHSWQQAFYQLLLWTITSTAKGSDYETKQWIQSHMMITCWNSNNHKEEVMPRDWTFSGTQLQSFKPTCPYGTCTLKSTRFHENPWIFLSYQVPLGNRDWAPVWLWKSIKSEDQQRSLPYIEVNFYTGNTHTLASTYQC